MAKRYVCLLPWERKFAMVNALQIDVNDSRDAQARARALSTVRGTVQVTGISARDP